MVWCLWRVYTVVQLRLIIATRARQKTHQKRELTPAVSQCCRAPDQSSSQHVYLPRGGMLRAAAIRRAVRLAGSNETRANHLKFACVANDIRCDTRVGSVRQSSGSAGNTIFTKHDDFSTRHIGPRECDRDAMLRHLQLKVSRRQVSHLPESMILP